MLVAHRDGEQCMPYQSSLPGPVAKAGFRSLAYSPDFSLCAILRSSTKPRLMRRSDLRHGRTRFGRVPPPSRCRCRRWSLRSAGLGAPQADAARVLPAWSYASMGSVASWICRMPGWPGRRGQPACGSKCFAGCRWPPSSLTVSGASTLAIPTSLAMIKKLQVDLAGDLAGVQGVFAAPPERAARLGGYQFHKRLAVLPMKRPAPTAAPATPVTRLPPVAMMPEPSPTRPAAAAPPPTVPSTPPPGRRSRRDRCLPCAPQPVVRGAVVAFLILAPHAHSWPTRLP